jgi:hypothetical protein
VFGTALEFDGDDVVVIANEAQFDLATGSYSFGCWIKPDPSIRNWGYFFSKSGDDETFALNRYGGTNNVCFSGGDSVGAVNGDLQGTVDVFDGQWHHIICVYDADTQTKAIYEDSVLTVGPVPYTTAMLTNDYAVNIGGADRVGPRRMEAIGLIDECAVWDHALSAEEVQDVFNNGIRSIRPALARNPNPADGAMLEATWATLGWRAGDFAVSHDVYIGESLNDVNNGAGGTFVGNQATDTLIVGFLGFPVPDGLIPGTTYYWRVDEVNDANAASPWKGDIWSFSIQPFTAFNPDPADGAEFVDLDAAFTWKPGFGGKLNTFYIGESYDDVNNATVGHPLGTPTHSPGPLEAEKVLYWRVDQFDGSETYKGDVWGFTTPGAVGNPQPANGQADVQMIATLGWTAADNATSHELYFGTDTDAVRNATTASPEYVGPKALGAESHDPGGFAWKTDYAWRVDEVYPTGTVKGLVWSFTTADFITVDDFESYNDLDPPDPDSNRIFDKWIDGFGTTTNGALIGNDLRPYAEQGIVRNGIQSMIYRYDNAGKTSEATLTLVYPRDWTIEGVTKLSMWVRGSSTNAADRLFVALNGTAVVYHDDGAATQLAEWKKWVIDLSAFGGFGVNLANVDTITIGVGTKDAPVAGGGTGTMYFDEIVLIR